LFENDGEAIYAAFQKVLRKGSSYAFQVLSDRAFGKLKETHALEHSVYKHQSVADLEAKIKLKSLRKSWAIGHLPSRRCCRQKTKQS